MAQTIGQETRRWFSYSISPSHHGHHDTPSFGNTPLYAKFALVGNRPRSACQEKTITFDGAQPKLVRQRQKIPSPKKKMGEIYCTRINNLH
ncbi:hypothetical protein QL285_094583 [Trifolium repens]|nr:hypothetical protein QL285_094583 [Trifolium repens]